MPPPSQKGKFKPRKPAKKIRPGASTGAASNASPEAAPSSPTNQTTTAISASDQQVDRGSDAGRTSGRGSANAAGRGRGGSAGRGGRGRGRAPLSQGQAFFTAAPPPSKTTKRNTTGRSFSSKSSGGSVVPDNQPSKHLKEKKANESSEEIVGQLDKAIGSSGGQGRAKKIEQDDEDSTETEAQTAIKVEENENKNSLPKSYSAPDGFTYDSDSSDEQVNIQQVRSSTILPGRLPFPVAPLPVGVGGHKRPLTYKNQANDTSYVEEEEKPVTASSHQANQIVEQQQPSPFVDARSATDLQKEMDSFFLFQFPTRLPTLLQQTSVKSENIEGNDENMEEIPAKAAESLPEPRETAEVSTAPVKAQCFDNVLINAAPGRLGKLLVYKSGKTVLVVEGPEGSPEVRLCRLITSVAYYLMH